MKSNYSIMLVSLVNYKLKILVFILSPLPVFLDSRKRENLSQGLEGGGEAFSDIFGTSITILSMEKASKVFKKGVCMP